MKPSELSSACVIVLVLPGALLACGGCTDAVLLMTLPWAGFGGWFLWGWIVTMLGVRWRLRRCGSEITRAVARGQTLGMFALLGSAGYVALSFLTMGSVLLPSLVIGFVWTLYLTIRLVVDLFEFIYRKDARLRIPIVINSFFALGVLTVVTCFQTKVQSLEHHVSSLRYGHHTAMYSKIMPQIVARGDDAVGPLIQATNKALADDDTYYRSNVVVNATYCLSRIGGPEAEEYLVRLLNEHRNPDDFGYRRAYEGVHFAYARCAGPRAVTELIRLFKVTPTDEDGDDRWIPLLALLLTGSGQGVAYVLDNFQILLDRMARTVDGNERRVLQAATGCVVFGDDPEALKDIPVYRGVSLMGDTSVAEPRPNDYNSEFFWIPTSEANLREEKEIRLEWEKNSASIRNRWSKLLDESRLWTKMQTAP